MNELRQECEEAVLAAAREERAAHTALMKGIGPQHPSWSGDEEAAYQARLKRWRAASRALVEALDGLERATKKGRPRSITHSA